MKALQLLVAACLVTTLPASAPETRIPFTLNRDRIVLPVTIGHSRPLRVLLDSGMGHDGLLIYTPELRDSLELPGMTRAQIGGAGPGGTQGALVADSASFRVGTVEMRGQRIIVLEGDAFRGFPSDGVTGYSLLGHHVVGIDYARRELVVRPPGAPPPDDSWTALPITIKSSGIPWIEVVASVDGRDSLTLPCYLDLASSETIELLTSDKQRFATPPGLEDVVIGRGLSGDVHGGRGTIAWLRLGPHRLRDVRAAFTPLQVRSRQAGAEAVTGIGLLRHFDCVFDYGARMLYVKLAADSVAAR